MIALCEVRGELMNTAEMELPTRDHPKNAGKITGRAAGSDALGCNCFRHPKTTCAERKHRRARVLEVQLSPIDLGDVREHGGGVASISVDKFGEVAKQLVLVDAL